MTWTSVTPALAQHRIARAWLDARETAVLGRIELRPHQREAAARLRSLLRDGGALLADPVGLGKTYTALAAVRHAHRLLVVAPASLRTMWREALDAAGMHAAVTSYEALSRRRYDGHQPDAVIADEAHHLRNPGTIRYAEMARLCARVPVLLLSATPVHNRTADLRAQLALFLGDVARTLDETSLARYIVKRESHVASHGGGPALPRVADVQWFSTGDDDSVLEAIMALPSPLPPEDGGDGGALLALSLVRQWASSRAALKSSLGARLAQAEALLAALAGNRYPTRTQLRSWCYADGALQLAFPQIASDVPAPNTEALTRQAQAQRLAVGSLLHALAASADPDDARAAVIREIMRRHPHARIIVFAEFAATVRALYTRLLPMGGVAMLTGRGGHVAGGPVTRAELLAQFTPQTLITVPISHHVRLLVTTDLFSEGVNLQQASVIVHADLPWSPARCEQRVGRVRRLGSPHAQVFVYGLRPPAPTNRLLRMEHRLREKVALAARTVGVRGTIMPRLFPGASSATPAPVEADAELTTLLEPWLLPTAFGPIGTPPYIAAMRAEQSGFIAAADWGAGVRLVAGTADRITASAAEIAELVRGLRNPMEPAVLPDPEPVLERLARWCAHQRALAPLQLPAPATSARRRLLHRIQGITRRVPPHQRARYSAAARQAWRAISATFSAGAERVLAELAVSELPDHAWLSAVSAFVELHARGQADTVPAVDAIVVLVAEGPP